MGRTVVCGAFEWDEDKARANLKKHKISFEEATRVFRDPYFFEVPDEAHSSLDEQRMVGIGILRGMVIAATVFVERGRVRIISSRRATKQEEARYYERRFGYRG